MAPDHVPIPLPANLQPLPGRFTLAATDEIAAAPGLAPVAQSLQAVLRAATSWALPINATAAGRVAIRLVIDAAIAHPEGYRLEVSETGVTIAASQPAGAFYGTQTLLQLFPPAIHEGAPRPKLDWSAPCVAIEDAPRFPWRGVLLDSSRHCHPVGYIKKFIDLMALQKLNVLHWHLIDDQGWRLEIKKYPRLTEIGAHRAESPRGHHNDGLGGDGVPHGGVYTQEEVRALVRYAAERFITIMPEIEMPGHVQSAIAAYPEFGCAPEPPAVSTTWGVHKHLFNAEEKTLRFLEDVLAEVTELFPGAYIHLGGDEAEKDEWKASAATQARIRELGLRDEKALQAYFVSRMAAFLKQRGRRTVCWDEILEEGALPADGVAMSWRGPQYGLEAARAGMDTVMTPHQSVYLDYYQTDDRASEPLAIGGCLPLEEVYAFEPIPAELPPECHPRVLGLQGNVWTEYMASPGRLEYMVFPRLCAIAEVGWSPAETRDFSGFRRRLAGFLKRLDVLGVRYRPLGGH